MPVNVDPLQITPYTSTVPLVQIPPDQMSAQTRPAQPLAGEFGKKGTGALAIGDSLLKGFMLGHQQKEQKKQAQAQATINAADAASEAAYNEYQQALTKAGGKQDDPAAKAAYDAYTTAFQAGKQAKAQFVIPEKTQKGKKAAADTDPVKSPDDKKKKQASAGFNNIKDFFEANPHIVPQIALVTMQPKPPGLAPQAQEQVQNLETNRLANEQKQRQLQNENTYQTGFSTYAHLGPDEIAALPPDAKKGYDAWQNSRAALTPMKFTGSPQLYKLPNGKIARLYKEEADQNYPGAEPYIAGNEVKPGSPAELEDKYFKSIGVTRADATVEQLAAATQYAKAAGIVPTSSTSSSIVNPQGDRSTTTTRTAKPGGIGKPPTASAAPSGQGISKPPQAGKTAQTAKTAQGGITPPPRGKETALTASVTRQAVKAQQEGYKKAETEYAKTIEVADKAFAAAQKTATTSGDPSILATAQKVKDAQYEMAQKMRDSAKAGVAKEYDAAVKSIGGTPGSQATADNPPQGATARVKDANGKLIGYAVNGQFVALGQ